jgi:heptosyltransferase III
MRLSPLVVHHGALGDTIQLTVMLQALATRWGAPCDVLAGPASAPVLLAGLPCVREVRFIGTRRCPYLLSPRQRRLVRWLHGRDPSPCYLVERWRHKVAPWSRRTRLEWLLERAGVPAERWVVAADQGREPLEHGVDFQLRVARLDPPAFVGAATCLPPGGPLTPRLLVPPEEVEECRAWLGTLGWRGQPLVLVQSEARRSRKRGRWPQERWRALIHRLLKDLPQALVLLMGSRDEARRTATLASAIADPRVANTAGDLPLRRLLALLTLAHSCVSLDTGPAQAAAALDCPVVILAGTADPRRNAALGPPERVQVATAYGDGPWPDSPVVWFADHRMEEIPVEAVHAAWRRLSPRGRGPRTQGSAGPGRGIPPGSSLTPRPT